MFEKGEAQKLRGMEAREGRRATTEESVSDERGPAKPPIYLVLQLQTPER